MLIYTVYTCWWVIYIHLELHLNERKRLLQLCLINWIKCCFPQTSNQNVNKSRHLKSAVMKSITSAGLTCTLCPQSIWLPVAACFKACWSHLPTVCAWPLTPRKRAIMPALSAILTVVFCLEKKISENICGAWKRKKHFIKNRNHFSAELVNQHKSVPRGNLSRWLGRRVNRPELGIKSRVCRRAPAEEEMQEQQLQPGALR